MSQPVDLRQMLRELSRNEKRWQQKVEALEKKLKYQKAKCRSLKEANQLLHKALSLCGGRHIFSRLKARRSCKTQR